MNSSLVGVAFSDDVIMLCNLRERSLHVVFGSMSISLPAPHSISYFRHAEGTDPSFNLWATEPGVFQRPLAALCVGDRDQARSSAEARDFTDRLGTAPSLNYSFPFI